MLKLTTELLLVNPDFYTIWNIRREAFNAQCKETDSKETRHAIGIGELRLLERCITVNPKSYYSWYHRRYIMEHFCDPLELENELKLCDQFLDIDERNCRNKYNEMIMEMSFSYGICWIDFGFFFFLSFVH